MASRFSSWYLSNKYPWESYDEARSRYELLYGPDKKPSKAPPKNEKLEVKDYDMQQKPIRGSTLNKRLGRTGVPRQEESGFLDDTLEAVGSVTPDPLIDLYQGGAVGIDEAHATIGSTTADILGPAVKGLGFEETGDDLIDWGRETYKEQTAEARAEEASHGEKLTALEQLRKEKGDPTYTPRTKEQIMAEEPDSTEAKIYDYLPDWVPSWEEAKAYRPTAYEVGRTATASGVPMVAAAGVGAAGIAAGVPITGTLAAMGVGGSLSALLVASEYGSETAKTNPVILKSLGLDPNVKFEDRPTVDQQKILKVGADSAQLTFGRRIVSSGVPEMIGYAPFGGVIFRTLLDMAGGTASEIWDIDVGEQAVVDALIANGVPQDKAYGIRESLREIGPKKQQVFTQALISEGVLSGGFSVGEVALHGAVSHQVDEAKTVSKHQEETKKKIRDGVLKDRQDQAKEVRKELKKKGELEESAGETVNKIIGVAEVGDLDEAVKVMEALDKVNPEQHNNVSKLLMAKRPDLFEQIGRRMGDQEMIDKVNEQWEKLNEDEAKFNEENEQILANAEKERIKEEKAWTKAEKERIKLEEEESEKKKKKKAAEEKLKAAEEKRRKDKEAKMMDDLDKKEAEEKAKAPPPIEERVKKLIEKTPKSKTKELQAVAKEVGVRILKKDTPTDVVNKIKKKAMGEPEKTATDTKETEPKVPVSVELESPLQELRDYYDDTSFSKKYNRDKNKKLTSIEILKDGETVRTFTKKELKETGAITENMYGQEVVSKNSIPAVAPTTKPITPEETTTVETEAEQTGVEEEVTPLADSKTFINEGMKAYKKKNKKATKEELNAENERLAKDWVNENRKIDDNPARRKYIDDAIEKERTKLKASATAPTTVGDAKIASKEDYSGEDTEKTVKVTVDKGDSDLSPNQINKIAARAGKEWDKKNNITSRSRSTRPTKRGVFGMTVDEVKKAVNRFKKLSKKFKDVKFNTLSKENKSDVNFMRKVFSTQFDSRAKDEKLDVENKDAWVEAQVNDLLKNTEGFVNETDGQIYVIAENIGGDIEVGEQGEQTLKTAPDRLVEVLFHETFGHHGLKKTLGDGFNTFINRFQKTNNRRLRRYFTEAEGRVYLPEQKGKLKERRKNYDQLSQEEKSDLAEEYIARNFAEFGARDPNILHRMGVHLQRAMNDMGWGRVSRDQVMMTLAEIQQDYIGGKRNFILGETFRPVGIKSYHAETGDEAVVETAELTPQEQYEARIRNLKDTKKKAEKAKAEPREVKGRTPEDMEEEYKERIRLFEQPKQAAVHNESTDEFSLHTYVKNKIKNKRKVRGYKAKPPKLEVVAQNIANAIQDKMPDRTKWKYGTESKPSEFDKVMEQAIADETIANSKKKPAKTKPAVKKSIKIRQQEFQAKVNKGLRDGSLESYNMSRQRIPEYGFDPISMERLTNIVVGFFEKYPDSPRVTLIPEGWMPETRIGWWSERRKRIYLQQGNIPDANQAVEVLFHEAIGHGSFLEGTPLAEQKKLAQIIKMSFPKEFKKYMDHKSYGHRRSIPVETHATLTRLYKPRPSSVESLHYEGDAKAYEAHKKRYKGWGFDSTGKRWQEPIENVELNVAIEVIARKAEYMVGLGKNDKVIVQNPIFWGKVQDWFRRMFADFATSLGVKPWKMSDDEFVAMMSRVSKRYETRGGMKVKGEDRALLGLLRMMPEGTKNEFDILTKGYEKDEVVRDDLKRQILESEEGRDLADLREMEDFLGVKTFRELKDEIYMEADALLDELQETRTPRPELPEQKERSLEIIKSESISRDNGLKYSRRVKPPPKKTIKGYKLFQVKKTKKGQVFPLFIGATQNVPTNEWQDAEVIEKKGFAVRPGWHLSDFPFALHIGTYKKNGLPTKRPPNQIWAEVEVANDVDWQAEANGRAKKYSKSHKRAGEMNPGTAEIKDQIPTDGNYRYKTNPNMEGEWIISGSIKINKFLSDTDVAEINKESGFNDLPRDTPLNAESYGIELGTTESKIQGKNAPSDKFIEGGRLSYSKRLLVKPDLEKLVKEGKIKKVKKYSVPKSYDDSDYYNDQFMYYDPKFVVGIKEEEITKGWKRFDIQYRKQEDLGKDGNSRTLRLEEKEGVIYRGMSDGEYKTIIESGFIRSKGMQNIGTQKGLTYFSTQLRSAQIYADSFAPRDFVAHFDAPAWIVGIKRPPNSRIRHVDGIGKHEVGIDTEKNDISKYEIVEVFKGEVMSYIPDPQDWRAGVKVNWRRSDPPPKTGGSFEGLTWLLSEEVETAEGRMLKGISQSKSLGMYAKYNKDAGVKGTMLLHENTRPNEGEFRITFFNDDGELDMARTENKMGHEHFPTLDEAEARLKKVGEDIQDISGGKPIKMSRKVPKADFDEKYQTEEGWDTVPPEIREKFEDGLISEDEAMSQTRIFPDIRLDERRHRLAERFFEVQGLEEIFPDVPSDIRVETYEVIDDRSVAVYTEAHTSRGTRKGTGDQFGYRVPKISKKTFKNPTLGELIDWEGDKGIKQSRKMATFTEELTKAEAKIDPVAFARGAERRVEEGKKVTAKRKSMAEKAGAAYRVDVSDEAVQKYLDSKSEEGHGTVVGSIKMSRKMSNAIPEELIGETAIGSISDRLIRGTYKPTWGRKSIHAGNIFLGGGPEYAFDEKNNTGKGGRGVWASQKASTTKTHNAVMNTEAKYGYIIVGKEDMHMSNVDVWNVAYRETLDALELGNKETGQKPDIELLDESAREAVKRYAPEFEGKITTFKELMELGLKNELADRAKAGKELSFESRKPIIKFLFGEMRAKKNNLVGFQELMRRTSAYPDAKMGDLVGILKFHRDKPNFLTNAKELGIKEHPSYQYVLQGEGVIKFDTPIPLKTYGKDWLMQGRRRFDDKGRLKSIQKPFFRKGQTDFSQENTIYTAEVISWMTGKPATSGKFKGKVVTKRPPRGQIFKQRTAEDQLKGALKSIDYTRPDFKITPEIVLPSKLTPSGIKQSRRMVRRSAEFSMSRMGDPALFEWQDKLAHKLTRRLVSQGTLNDVEMYKELRRRNQGVMMLAEKAGERLFKILANSDQQNELYEYFTTRNADSTVIKDIKERKAAENAKKQINEIGKKLVKRGLMTQASLDKYGDQYLPRKYLKYLLSDSDFKKISAGGANTKLDLKYLEKRKDIPKGIRELILGEIKDPAFLSSAAITAPLRDMAMLDWLEQIAIEGKKEGRGWVLPSTLVKFDTVKMMRQLAGSDTELINQLQLFDTGDSLVSGHWLMNEADRIQEMVDHHMVLEPEKERLVRRLIAKMKEEGTKITGAIIPKNYVRVPKGRKYGKLSGMAVRKEIFQDIWGSPQSSFDVDDKGYITMSAAEKLLGTGGGFEQFNRFWKWSKVSANPPSWVRNFISNMVFMTLGPIPIWKLPFLFRSALVDQIRTRLAERRGETVDSMTTLADRMGLTSAGFSQVELKLVKNNFDKIKNKGHGVGALLHIKNAFKGLQGKTSDLYGGIDTLGKVMMLTHLKKKGWSDDRAAMEAEKWLFDYSNPLPSVKYLRQTAFGAPFLSYPSFVAPLLIETIIKRPWKFAPYFIFGEVMTAMFKEQQDIDDEEWQATLETMPKHLRNKAVGGSITDILFPKSVIPIWWPQMWGGSLDANKRAQPVDIGYLVPWGMFAEVARELDPTKEEGWQPADAVHSVGLLGAPLLNIATTVLTNRDPFSDRELYDEFATQGEKTASWFHYMWNLSMPPMLHGVNPFPFDSNLAGPGKGYGAIRRLIDTIEGKVTIEGEPRFTMGQAVARMFGINITPIAPHEARTKDAFFEMQKIKRLERRIAHNYKAGVFNQMTEAQLKEQVQRDVDKLNKLIKKLKDKLAKPLPQSLKRSRAEQLKVREKFLKNLRRRRAG